MNFDAIYVIIEYILYNFIFGSEFRKFAEY